MKKTVNDIEVYVEDTTCPRMWLRIIHRLLPGIRLRSVNQLGGRANVVAACKLDQKADRRKRIYIIDGDFDQLLGRRKPRLKHLVRLQAYCVENLLLRREALFSVAAESAPNLADADVAAAVNYPHVARSVSGLLGILFRLYAASILVTTGVKTVSYSVYRLMRKQAGIQQLSADLVRKRIREFILEVCQKISRNAFNQAFSKISKNSAQQDPMLFVSGKDYLLPIFYTYLRVAVGYRGSIEQFKVRLAAEYDPSASPVLSRALKAL